MLLRTGFIKPCQPSSALRPPLGENWLHEIKHDGYRVIALRADDGVRLLTRHGNNWAERFPSAATAIQLLEARSCLIDGEMVVCNDRGLAVFDLFRRGPQVKAEAFLYAFDLLELDGRDLRREPIEVRKTALANLLRGAKPGIQFSEHLQGDGPIIFEHACKLGCEGIVSKRRGSRYRSGTSSDWIKVKNPKAPAVRRESEEDWVARR
jgi:bifunctional non-homologous end joining protein LigD